MASNKIMQKIVGIRVIDLCSLIDLLFLLELWKKLFLKLVTVSLDIPKLPQFVRMNGVDAK